MSNLDDAISCIINKSVNNMISENLLFDITDSFELSDIEFSILCQRINDLDILIVSNEQFQTAFSSNNQGITVTDKYCAFSDDSKKYDEIVKLFNNLDIDNQLSCLSILNNIVGKEQNIYFKEKFISLSEKKVLNYSYMALLVKATFESVNEYGNAPMNKIVDYIYNYYSFRKKQNLPIEKSNTILSKGIFTHKDILFLLIHNPLRRSYLSEFFHCDKNRKYLTVNPNLWNSLTKNDIQYIINLFDNKLKEYYAKL